MLLRKRLLEELIVKKKRDKQLCELLVSEIVDDASDKCKNNYSKCNREFPSAIIYSMVITSHSLPLSFPFCLSLVRSEM